MTMIMKAAANMTITAVVIAIDHLKKGSRKGAFLYVDIKILLYIYKDSAKKVSGKRCNVQQLFMISSGETMEKSVYII